MKFIIIISAITFFAQEGFSQSLYNNGATISIEEGTIFSVGQDAYNNGTIFNNGNFVISGAWINNGTYNPGIGDFTLNSANEQIVNHNSQSFQRLVISGGGRKIFLADLSIQDTLELVDGVLFSENQARLIVNENANIIGGSANSYIAGALFLPNNPQLFYPIGTGSAYLPVELNNVVGEAGLIGFTLLEPNPVSATESGDISTVSNDYAWLRMDSLGSMTSATVMLPLLNQTALGKIEKVVVLEASDINGAFRSAGSNNVTGDLVQGSITSSTAISGKVIALGSVNNEINRELIVINAVTPEMDGMHDFLRIENIEFYPDNIVKIFNRWGDLVWEIQSYDNSQRLFTGKANKGISADLENGTYYYVIEYAGDHKSGFFVLRR